MPESRQRSVRRQLLVLLLTTVSVAWVIAATVSFRDARHEVAEVLDAHLAQTASLISVQRDGDERKEDEVDLHLGTIRLDSPATTIGLQVTIALPRVVDERA